MGCLLSAQNVGIFNTWEDYLDNHVEKTDKLILHEDLQEALDAGYIPEKWVSTKDKALKKRLKKSIAALSIDDSVYVNLRLLTYNDYQMGGGFIKVNRHGHFLYFKAPPLDEKTMNRQSSLGFGAGFFFGAIGGALMIPLASTKDVYYYVDPYRELVKQVTPEVLLDLLEKYPKLLAGYKLEEKPKKKETVEKYLELYFEDVKLREMNKNKK